MNALYSSLYRDRTGIRLEGRRIVVEALPGAPVSAEVSLLDPVRCRSAFRQAVPSRLPARLDPGLLPDGEYQLHLREAVGSGWLRSLGPGGGFPIRAEGGALRFLRPAPFARNQDLFLQLSDDFVRKYRSSLVPYTEHIPDEVAALARSIVRHAYGNYEKILAVHDWVADNISYDEDSVRSGRYRHARTDPLSILKSRRTVCQGYASLATALLRAVGVRAVNVDCFALGISTEGGWENPANRTAPANHVVTFAYADRWVMMDATWDSPRVFKDGRFATVPGKTLSREYFDGTIAYFSYTHRFLCPEGII